MTTVNSMPGKGIKPVSISFLNLRFISELYVWSAACQRKKCGVEAVAMCGWYYIGWTHGTSAGGLVSTSAAFCAIITRLGGFLRIITSSLSLTRGLDALPDSVPQLYITSPPRAIERVLLVGSTSCPEAEGPSSAQRNRLGHRSTGGNCRQSSETECNDDHDVVGNARPRVIPDNGPPQGRRKSVG